MNRRTLFVSLLVVGIVAGFVLGFYQTSQAAPKNEQPIFNSAQQRLDTLNELKVIATLLREQNQLLREQNAILQNTAARK